MINKVGDVDSAAIDNGASVTLPLRPVASVNSGRGRFINNEVGSTGSVAINDGELVTLTSRPVASENSG